MGSGDVIETTAPNCWWPVGVPDHIRSVERAGVYGWGCAGVGWESGIQNAIHRGRVTAGERLRGTSRLPTASGNTVRWATGRRRRRASCLPIRLVQVVGRASRWDGATNVTATELSAAPSGTTMPPSHNWRRHHKPDERSVDYEDSFPLVSC